MCVHEKKRPFKCDVCQADFGRNSDLKRHISKVHDNLFKSNLTRHTSNFHKENFQENKVKEILEFKTERVQDYIEKPTFVELKGEDINKWELNNPPAVQIKTEILNLQNESAQNDELILVV